VIFWRTAIYTEKQRWVPLNVCIVGNVYYGNSASGRCDTAVELYESEQSRTFLFRTFTQKVNLFAAAERHRIRLFRICFIFYAKRVVWVE